MIGRDSDRDREKKVEDRRFRIEDRDKVIFALRFGIGNKGTDIKQSVIESQNRLSNG